MSSSETSKPRAALLTALNQEMRTLGSHTILFHQAVAERLGLNATDHKCADLLSFTGPLTAGELAERTGLTTGAITGVVDRLERAGYVRRERDPGDRRRVIIRPDAERLHAEVAPLFSSLKRGMDALCAGYDDGELAILLDFVTRAQPIFRAEVARLRADEEAGARTLPPGDPAG